jgi:hypothetical protein
MNYRLAVPGLFGGYVVSGQTFVFNLTPIISFWYIGGPEHVVKLLTGPPSPRAPNEVGRRKSRSTTCRALTSR